MEKSKKGVMAASVAGAVIVMAGILFFLAPSITGSTPPPTGGDSNKTTTVASRSQAPEMLLMVLQGSQDRSNAVARYEANNTEPIQLARNSHIRFDSPDYRTAEGMRVTARDMDTGEILLLRKSYNVNNEFFVNLDDGHYQLRVQASWFEVGSFVYRFDIAVV